MSEIRTCEQYVLGRMLALEDEVEELEARVEELKAKLKTAEETRDFYVGQWLDVRRKLEKIQDEAIKADGFAVVTPEGEVV